MSKHKGIQSMIGRMLMSVLLTMVPVVAGALPLVGLYRTIDDETGRARSIVALYEYKDDAGRETLGGRIVGLYNDAGDLAETPDNATKVASKVAGNPTVVGMDIIWNMRWDANKNQYSGGNIMDPANGKVYGSVIWRDGDKLNVRGKIGPFGRTQNWVPVDAANVPASLTNIDTTKWKPIIRK